LFLLFFLFPESPFEANLDFLNKLLCCIFGPCDGVKINRLVLAFKFRAAHLRALKASARCGIEQSIRDENLLGLRLMLYPRRGVNNVAKHIVVPHQTQAVMQANANPDLVDFCPAFAILGKRTLHTGSGLHGADRIVELGQNRVSDCFDNAAAFSFDHGKQYGVMVIDHLHVCEIAHFFGIRRRTPDVAEENRHGRAQLLELQLRLSPSFQQFREFVLFHSQGVLDYSKSTPDPDHGMHYNAGPLSPGNSIRRTSLIGMLPCLTNSS